MDNKELTIQEQPSEVVAQGSNNASVLMKIVSQKKWAVNINGKNYLQFEAWQTLARFYGLSVRTVETKYVEYGEIKGFEATSEVVNKDGVVVGRGEGACLTDEKTWKNRPLFSLKAMAQTRASGRALRQMLSWVAVLAGYAPTAAEEMPRETEKVEVVENPISKEQNALIQILITQVGRNAKKLKEGLGIQSFLDLSEAGAEKLIKALQAEKEKMKTHEDVVDLEEIEKGIEAQNINN